MSAPDYALRIEDLNDATILDDLTVSDLTYGEVLNGPGSITFTVPLDAVSSADLAPGKRQVRLKRAGELVWGGYLWSSSVDLASGLVSFSGEGFFSRLRRRIITEDLFYFGVDQVEIAWGLIHWTQSQAKDGADLGITRFGTGTSGYTRHRHWCCYDLANVGDEITSLAESLHGFDFRVGPDKKWWTSWDQTTPGPRRGSEVNVTFDLGSTPGDETNVLRMRWTKDATSLTTEVTGTGPDEDCTDLSTYGSSGQIAAYGLLQDSLDLSDIREKDDRDDKLQEELRLRNAPVSTIEIVTTRTPFESPRYATGDVVTVTGGYGYATFSSDPYRVMSWEVSVQGGQETATVMLDSVT